MLYDSTFHEFLGKLQMRWLGPYEVSKIYDKGTIFLTMIDDLRISILVNGHQFHLYHQTLTRDSFHEINNDENLQVVA